VEQDVLPVFIRDVAEWVLLIAKARFLLRYIQPGSDQERKYPIVYHQKGRWKAARDVFLPLLSNTHPSIDDDSQPIRYEDNKLFELKDHWLCEMIQHQAEQSGRLERIKEISMQQLMHTMIREGQLYYQMYALRALFLIKESHIMAPFYETIFTQVGERKKEGFYNNNHYYYLFSL
jgi:hypothetical protein